MSTATATLFPPNEQERRDLDALEYLIRAGGPGRMSFAAGTNTYRLARELEDAGRVKMVCYGRRQGVALYRALLVTGKGAR